MNWLTYPYYTVPAPTLVIVPNGGTITIMADVNYNLAQAISQDIRDYVQFLAATPDPQYKDPISYTFNLITYAQSLTHTSYAQYTVPKGWDPVETAISYANQLFQILNQIPVNVSDPDTVSVYTAWANHNGQLFGGHPAASPTPVAALQEPGTPPSGSIL